MAVFHLKYRPAKFEELDLVEVGELLTKILKAKEMPQSFLFAGPKGSGKTSSARIMARAINCVSPKGTEPCNECEACKDILSGSSLDIIEIDAASNRGIEDVRALKDKAYLLPAKLKKKVFIIDEVHMLTKEAFNALLKLIEEPPKHTIFILCTTDPEKIPETVLSRLVRVDFRKGGKKEMEKSLKKIIEGEGIEIENEAIELIIERSDGSFRNLQRTFNEIFLELGKTIKPEMVKEFFELKSGDYNEAEFEADMAAGEVKTILEKLEKMADKGVDFSSFREKLIAYFQKRLLTFYGVGEISKEKGLKVGEMTALLNSLVMAGKLEKEVEIDQLPLELVVVEFFGEKPKKEGGNKPEKEETQEIKEEKKEPKVEETAPNIKKSNVSFSKDEVTEKWGRLLLAVRPFNHSVEAFLRAAKPRDVKDGVFALEVYYPFHKDKLEEAKNRKIVESGLREVFGADLEFKCILSKDKRQPLVIDNSTPIQVVSQDLVEAEKKPVVNQNNQNDIYDAAKEIFG